MFMEIPQVKVYVSVLAILIFIFCNKLLGILAIFLVYELFNINQEIETPIFTETIFEKKSSIEEEIIHKMGSTIDVPNYNDKCLYTPFENNVGFLV